MWKIQTIVAWERWGEYWEIFNFYVERQAVKSEKNLVFDDDPTISPLVVQGNFSFSIHFRCLSARKEKKRKRNM